MEGPIVSVGVMVVQPTVVAASSRAPVTNRRPTARECGVMARLWTRSIDVCFFTVCRLDASRSSPIFPISGTAKHCFPFPLPPSERGAPIGQAPLVPFNADVRLRQSGHGDCFVWGDLSAVARA